MKNDKNFQVLLKDNEPVSQATNEKRPSTANNSVHSHSPKALQALDSENDTKYVAKTIKITLMSNWGHRQLIGLTGRSLIQCYFCGFLQNERKLA